MSNYIQLWLNYLVRSFNATKQKTKKHARQHAEFLAITSKLWTI